MLPSLLGSLKALKQLAHTDEIIAHELPNSDPRLVEGIGIASWNTNNDVLVPGSFPSYPASDTISVSDVATGITSLRIEDTVSAPGPSNTASGALSKQRVGAADKYLSDAAEGDPSLETFPTAATFTSLESMPVHHNKLFSSSMEFHCDTSLRLPEKLQDLTLADAMQSVGSIVKNTSIKKVFRPSNRFGPLSVWGFEQPAVACLPPQAFSTTLPAPPKYEHDKRQQLESLSNQIDQYHHQLLGNDFGDQSEEVQVQLLDEAVAYAQKGWESVGKNMIREKERKDKAVLREQIKSSFIWGLEQASGSDLQEQRDAVRERIWNLQLKIAVLYASKPLPVDAGHLYNPPIAQCHKIGQVSQLCKDHALFSRRVYYRV
ncbi:hypothetical protein V5O48_010508 [Marasmius crinis-equi]|uniref:Uncharacterized protein n=1 Tax=Marasmius crinis-equi TaxID=585013 RepID=A0ABR3F8L8_9AGAR